MAKLWDVQSGELMGTFKGHQCSLKSVAFSKQGKGTVYLHTLVYSCLIMPIIITITLIPVFSSLQQPFSVLGVEMETLWSGTRGAAKKVHTYIVCHSVDAFIQSALHSVSMGDLQR